MNSDYTNSFPETRKRRRKTSLPGSVLALDYICLAILSLITAGVIWVLGGNRFWIMSPAILLLLFSVILFLARFFWSSSRSELVVPPGGYIFWGFVGYLVLIIALAEIPYEAKLETFRYLSYAAAYWMWVNLLHVNSRWKWVLALLMLSVSIMAWYALIQEVKGTRMVVLWERPEQYRMRASGSYFCPNHFANLLEMMIPICLAVMLSRSSGLAMRLISGYTILISLPSLYLAESRSGWIGLMVGVIVFALALSIRRGVKKFLLVLILAPLLAGGLGVLVWQLSPRVQERLHNGIRGDIRPALWQDSLAIAQESPILGNGLGSYRWMYPHYRVHFTSNADPEFAHNEFLQYWGEIGIIGLLLMALVGGRVVSRAIRLIKADQNDDEALMMSGMLGCIAGALAHAFFDFNFHIFGNAHVFVFLVAVMISATHGKATDKVISMKPGHFRWLGAGMAIVVILLGAFYTRNVISYSYAESAKKRVMKMEWDRSMEEYQKAIQWSEDNWRAHVGLAHLLRTRIYWVRNPEIRSQWIDDAHRHYTLALEMNPWEADILYGMGSLYKMQGDHEKALEMRRLTVEKVPRQTFYLNELGIQLKDMKRYDEAIEVFRESMRVERTPVAEKNIEWLRKAMTANN